MASSTVLDILLIAQQCSLYAGYIIIGMIGNFLTIFVFWTLKIFRKNPCVFYFTAEAFANMLQLLILFLIHLLPVIYGTDPANSVLFWCKFRSIIIALCTLIAFSAICFCAFDQYLSTNYQVNLRQMSTIKLAQRLTFTAICISILQSIPIGVFTQIRASVCTIFDPKMAQYISYVYYPVLSGILPISISSIFTILAYRNVRRIISRRIPVVRRRLDRQLTAMVLMRVIIFVILTLPYTINRMYTYISHINQSDSVQSAVISLVSVIMSILFNLNYAV
jgi:hypothetical protein